MIPDRLHPELFSTVGGCIRIGNSYSKHSFRQAPEDAKGVWYLIDLFICFKLWKKETNIAQATLCTLPFLSAWTLPNCFLGSKPSSCEAENSTIGSISVWKRAYPDASHSDEISVIRLFLSKGLKAHGAWIVKWCLSRKICHSRGHFGIPEDALLISSEGRKALCMVKDAAVGRKQSFFLFRSFWRSVFFFSMLSESLNEIIMWKLNSFVLDFWQVAKAVTLLKHVISHARLRSFKILQLNQKTVEICLQYTPY